MYQDSHAVVKLEVALGTVSNCYTSDCRIKTAVEPQCLCKKEDNSPVNKLQSQNLILEIIITS